jgi:hypothetical protein
MPEETKPANPSALAASVMVKPVKFIHEKGAQYRIFHADGGWGSINYAGNLQIDFIVERPKTAEAVIAPVNPDGSFTGEQKLVGVEDRDYILVTRDFQCGVILSLNAAAQIHDVLGNYLRANGQDVGRSPEGRKE